MFDNNNIDSIDNIIIIIIIIIIQNLSVTEST